MRRPGHPLSRTQGERDGVRGVSINHLVVGHFHCSLHAPREDFLTRSVRTTFKLTHYPILLQPETPATMWKRRSAQMLQNQTANLSQEQRQKVHPDFLADEQAYLNMRASLLGQYRGQWVAVQSGKVTVA